MAGDNFGLQTASGYFEVAAESKEPYDSEQLAQLRTDGEAIIARYPQKRSALLPMLHLVQSVDGYVTGRGIAFCAQMLGLSTAEVSGVATFYTQYKRHPNGDYTVGVCTNTLCAIMGGDQIWDTVSEHLGIGHDETTEDGKITLERVECNAACDYAPVVMANWEFFDNQTPESTVQLVDDLREGKAVKPTRGPDSLCTFKQMSRTLAGFSDGLADQGVGAGHASLVGLELAKANGWTAPGEDGSRALPAADEANAAQAPVEDKAAEAPAESEDKAAEAPAEDKTEEAPELKPTEAVETAAVTGAAVGGAALVEEAVEQEESRTAADDAARTAVDEEADATAAGLAADTEADEEIAAEDAAPAPADTATTDADTATPDAESDDAAEQTDKPAASAEHEVTDGSPAAAPEAVDAESDAAKVDDDAPAASDDAKGQVSAKAPADKTDEADDEPAPETDVPVGTPEATQPGVPERGVAAGVDPAAADQTATDDPADQTIPRSALRSATPADAEPAGAESEVDDTTVSRAQLREAAAAQAAADEAPTPVPSSEPETSAPSTLISSVPTSDASAAQSGMLPVFDEPDESDDDDDRPGRHARIEPDAAAEDDDVAAARARIAAVGRSTAAPVEAYQPDEAELTVARHGLTFEQGEFGEGSAKPGPRGQGPEGWSIKGNANSMLFHTPDSPWYKRTKAEVWFRDEESAIAAGFRNVLDKDDDGKDGE